MQSRKSFTPKRFIYVSVLTLLVSCAPFVGKVPMTEKMNSSPAVVQATQESILAPSFLAQWTIGNPQDVAWSPDSKSFAINYLANGNNVVQAFSVVSLKSIWTASNSLASDLVFTPDGKFIVESNTHVPLFYWRNIEQGNIVHMGEFKDTEHITSRSCSGGGQVMIENAKGNFAVMADYNALIGLNGPGMVFIRQLDLGAGKCKELFNYQDPSLDFFFDLNSGGTLLAYGGVGKDDSVVIWDMEKQAEVCRISPVVFERFVPGGNTLAIVRDKKIVFLDATTCKEIKELNVSPLSGYETYLAFSPDGQEFAIARDSIQIMNVSTGEILTQISIPQNTYLISWKLFWGGIKFSPDGRYLLTTYTTSNANEIQLWQLKQ